MKTIYRLALIMAAGAMLVTSLPLRAADSKDKDGGVTLTGYVAGQTRKSLAQETVAGWVRAEMRSELAFHRNASGSGTESDIKEGITLRAKATSEAQKELITEYAKDVTEAVEKNKTTSEGAPLEPLLLNPKMTLGEMPVAGEPKVPARLERALAMKSPLVHPLGSRPVWVSGALVEAVKGEHLLQLVNPFAPKHYDLGGEGISVITLSW